jgi:hypothetical protein
MLYFGRVGSSWGKKGNYPYLLSYIYIIIIIKKLGYYSIIIKTLFDGCIRCNPILSAVSWDMKKRYEKY